MAFLTRIDPTRNISRFYIVEVMPSLFGDWTVMREWGRRGGRALFGATIGCAILRPARLRRSSFLMSVLVSLGALYRRPPS
jgi:hypothetical protein